jgi:hypothetical protein
VDCLARKPRLLEDRFDARDATDRAIAPATRTAESAMELWLKEWAGEPLAAASPGNGVAVLTGERSRRTALLQRQANRILTALLHGEDPSVVVEVGRDKSR